MRGGSESPVIWIWAAKKVYKGGSGGHLVHLAQRSCEAPHRQAVPTSTPTRFFFTTMTSKELKALKEVPAANRNHVMCLQCHCWAPRNVCDPMKVEDKWVSLPDTDEYFPVKMMTVDRCWFHDIDVWIEIRRPQ